MPEPVSQILGPLVMMAGKALPLARQLHVQRVAGRSLAPPSEDLLGAVFSKTLRKLTRQAIDDAWWRKILVAVQQQWITPELLKHGGLQVWLQDEDVQESLKDVARARVLGLQEPEEPTRLLRERYKAITAQLLSLADTTVDAVVGILMASLVAEMSPGEQGLAGIVQASAEEQRHGLQRIEGALGRVESRLGEVRLPDAAIQALAERISTELGNLNKRRGFDPEGVCAEVRALAERVLSGDLAVLPSDIKIDVLYWAARLHASQPESVALVWQYRERLLSLDPEANMRVIDALLLEAEGNTEQALRLLRDGEDADLRANLMAVLHRSQGPMAMLEWFDNQQERDRYDFLTGAGWCNLAGTLAEANRWEEAVQRLARVTRLYEDWPDLPFVEGVLNAALLLPQEFRPHALRMNIFYREMRTREGPDAEATRRRAKTCLLRAVELLEPVSTARASAAQDWLLWLGLTSANKVERTTARDKLGARLRDPRTAVSVVQIAVAFDIPFDVERLWNYLEHRSRVGGHESEELLARVLLAELRMSAGEFASFLEQEERGLRSVLREDAIIALRIEGLVRDRQATRARRLLESRSDSFEKSDLARLSALVAASEGEDPRAQLEELYAETGDLIDLKNLLSHLSSVTDWAAATPLLEDLFRRERTSENARRLIDGLYQDSSSGARKVLDFLASNEDLLKESVDFRHARARALFHTGDVVEARELVRRLREERDSTADLHLAINLALQIGDWAQFPELVEEVWAKRDDHDAQSLLHAASLAAEVDATVDRAAELVRLAATKGWGDAQVLSGASSLMFRLGREGEETRDWLSRALELSTDDGPVKTVNLRVLVEDWMPAEAEKVGRIEGLLVKGAMPIHLATGYLNTALASVFSEVARENSLLRDGRRRTMVPVFAGNRKPVSIPANSTLGLDLTTILLLGHLELLEVVLTTFSRVLLAPETMVALLNERSRARYHQPKQVQQARDVLELIASNQLRLATDMEPACPQLAEQVGQTLAELLGKARATDGRVIHPLPVQRISSFEKEAADLGSHSEELLSTLALAELLRGDGVLGETDYESAVRYLRTQDAVEQSESPTSPIAGPIYLEGHGLAHLQSAGLLARLAASSFDVRVHPSLKAEKDALVARHQEGERVAAAIENIRILLKNSILDGRVGFLPRLDPTSELSSLYDASPSLSQFFATIGCCDLVSFDDRFLNRSSVFGDVQQNTATLVCTLDLVRHLEKVGELSSGQRMQIHHRLREGGFALVPLELDELRSLLDRAALSEEGDLVETAELRVLRQYLARIRSLEMIEDSRELAFLDGLQIVAARTLYSLWSDERVPTDLARRLSTWLWFFVSPAPEDWLVGADPPKLRELCERHLFLPLQLGQALSGERGEAYRAWVETVLISPLLLTHSEVVDASARHAGAIIESQVQDLEQSEDGVDR